MGEMAQLAQRAHHFAGSAVPRSKFQPQPYQALAIIQMFHLFNTLDMSYWSRLNNVDLAMILVHAFAVHKLI